jgi:hypothetical protein
VPLEGKRSSVVVTCFISFFGIATVIQADHHALDAPVAVLAAPDRIAGSLVCATRASEAVFVLACKLSKLRGS